MKKNNVKIKENITFKEELNAIEYITASNFNIDQTTGEVSYTPEFEMAAEFEAIALFFIDGIEFEEEDVIYEQIIKDKDINKLIMQFYLKDDDKENKKDNDYISIRNFVVNNAQRKIEFTLQKLIHSNPVMDELIHLLSELSNILSNFDFSNLTKLKDIDVKVVMKFIQKLSTSKITESSITSALKEAIKFDDKTAEIIDSKNEEINSLKMRIEQLEGNHSNG